MQTDRLITIGAIIAAVVALAALSERWFRSQERRLEARYRGDFAAAKTRFRVVRRVVVVVVILFGTLSALTTIPATGDIASALLASSAVAAVIAGFALRTPLGNVAAGIQLAFTQPFRLGDRIAAHGLAGVVEEIKLSYTVLRTDDGRRAYLPNEQLITTPIVNATIEDPTRAETATLPVAPDADLAAAAALLLAIAHAVPSRVAEPAPTVRVAEVTPQAVLMAVTVWVADGTAAAEAGSSLRAEGAGRLHAAGMLARPVDGG